MTSKLKQKRSYPITVILILLILSLTFAYRHIWPFGNISLLSMDMEIQYVNIYNWFYDVLHGSASLFYDFSKSLGGNMFGIWSTYLASPINLLVYFFPHDRIPYFITLSTVIKVVLSGLFCLLYIRKRFAKVPEFHGILLAVSYALIEYNVNLCSNLHFLDIVYFLPVLALGVYRLIQKKDVRLFALGVAVVILFNWYIGYAACLFTAVYFVFEIIIQNRMKMKEFFSCFGRYIGCAAAGVMIACITFMPSVLATLNGKGEVSLAYLKPHFHCSFMEPLKALMYTALDVSSYEEPAIFTGSLILAIVFIGMIDRRIEIRKKAAVGMMLFLIFLSFSFVPLEVVLSGMKKTYSFHFRYSFIFSFALIASGALFIESYQEKGQKPSVYAAVAAVLLTAAFGAVGHFKEWFSFSEYLVLLIPFSMFALSILFMANENPVYRKCAAVLAAFMLCSELTLNASHSFARSHIRMDDYSVYVNDVQKLIDEIKESDQESFYRIEKTFSEMDKRRNEDGKTLRPVATEGLTFNYNAITHYSSLIDTNTDDFLSRLGYTRPDALCSDYVGYNPVADSFLGVKYLLSEKDYSGLSKLRTVSYEGKEAVLYKNENALKLITPFNGEETEISFGDNPFENQNDLIKTLSGIDQDLYDAQPFTQTDSTEWQITVNEDGPVYIYFSDDHQQTDLYINDEYVQSYYGRFYTDVLYIGDYVKGDVITARLDEECTKTHTLYAYVLNEKAYEEVFADLKAKSFNPDVFEDGKVSFIVSSDEDQKLLLSMPYDKGWDIRIDGQKAEFNKAYDALIAVDVPEGTHKIDMKYHVPYLKTGALVSFAGWILFFLLVKMKKPQDSSDKDTQTAKEIT